MPNKKNTQLFSIIDELYDEWVVIEGSLFTDVPNRLDKLNNAAKSIEEISIRMQKHIELMRRK